MLKKGKTTWLSTVFICFCVIVNQASAGSNPSPQKALNKSSNTLHLARQRALITLHQDKFKNSHNEWTNLYNDEGFTESYPKNRKRLLKSINWSKKYKKIKLMSKSKTQKEFKRLLIDAPNKIKKKKTDNVEAVIQCMDSIASYHNSTLVWFQTSSLNIYVGDILGFGLFWTICDRRTDHFIREPVSESGCSAGSPYRRLRFRDYIRNETPFIEAYEGGCRGHDPYYEALYDLEDNARDVEGSVYGFPTRYKVSEQTELYSWYVPDFKGYGGFESESWSARGERRWTRIEYVQIYARESSYDEVCKDKHLARRYKCKDGRVPDPAWKRICRISKKTRKVTCKRKLLRRESAEPFFDRCIDCYYHSDNYKIVLGDFYRMRLNGVETLRELGYDIPDELIERLRKKLQRIEKIK